jgi:hypothetical protein
MKPAELIKSHLYANMPVQTVEAIRVVLDAMQSAHEEQPTDWYPGMTEKHYELAISKKVAAALASQPKPAPVLLTDEAITELWSWSMSAEAEKTASTQQHAFARAIESAVLRKNNLGV